MARDTESLVFPDALAPHITSEFLIAFDILTN